MRSKRPATTDIETSGPPLRVLTDRFHGRAVFDTAVSHAILREVAAGRAPETIRLYVPDDVVVFSLLDSRRPGFADARRVAAENGFADVLRLAGGHAALFHTQCLAFSWAMPDDGAPCGIKRRFERMSRWWAAALSGLGIDARVGEVPGEYCPGEYSVNARGAVKLMGVGQRVIRGAAHVGGVVVVRNADLVRKVLEPIYDALELEWVPETAGAVEGETPGIDVVAVRDALLATLGAEYTCSDGTLDQTARDVAEMLLDWHDPAASPRGTGPARSGSKLVVSD